MNPQTDEAAAAAASETTGKPKAPLPPDIWIALDTALNAFAAVSDEEITDIGEAARQIDPEATGNHIAAAVQLIAIPSTGIKSPGKFFLSALTRVMRSSRYRRTKTTLETKTNGHTKEPEPMKTETPLDPSKEWDRIRATLKQKITPISYDNWFRYSSQLNDPTSPADPLIVSVPDDVTREVLESEYSPAIHAAAMAAAITNPIVWRPTN